MRVSVVIPTWNRMHLLERTLASLAQLEIPADVTWEVLVVNNNSTDATEQVLDRFQSELPLVRLFVPQPGKSHAMNAAIPAVRSDLTIWIDDDVECPSDWLRRYVEAARRYPLAEFFGGPIVPRFLAEVPAWVQPAWRTVSGLFAALDLGDRPFLLDKKRLPFGANFAVRTPLQKRSPYDVRLGRVGGQLTSSEETALMQDWLRQGYRGMWVPEAKVEHLITPDRLTLAYLRRFFFGLGQSKERRRQQGLRRVTRPGRLLWYWIQGLRAQTLERHHGARGRTDQWVKYISRSAYNWGRLDAAWGPLPQHFKPAAVKRLKNECDQPRSAEPKPDSSGERVAA